MMTFLVVTAVVLSLTSILGGGMIRGAGRVVGFAWWGGAITMIAIWYWWAHRAVG